MHRIAILWGAAALAAVALATPALAQSSGGSQTLEQRVARLERLLNSGTLVQLLDEVQLLQQELQDLRGQVEVQTHTLSQLKDRQRDLYLDLDRRLQRVETAGARAAQPGAPASAEGAESASAAAEAPSAGGAAAAAPETGVSETPAPQAQVASAAPQSQPQAPASAVDPVAEQKAYQDAFNLLKAGRYEDAVKALKAFLGEYPSSKYADNAQYWLGEAYYVNRQFEPALAEFRKLVEQYPGSQKVSHALLKIGYIHYELGQYQEAQQELNDLMQRYPNTTAARLAQERLQQMRAQSQ
jgi:tol-pal system protein YbgF